MPEKQWVFDTVSLSNFLLADAPHILRERYGGRGIITSEVYAEIVAGIANYPLLRNIEPLIRENHFMLAHLTAKEHEYFRELLSFLGKGEASCLAFAKANKATVVSDDKTVRKQCTQMGLSFTGTVGILKTSVLSGLLDPAEADDFLSAMINAGFYSPVRAISDIV